MKVINCKLVFILLAMLACGLGQALGNGANICDRSHKFSEDVTGIQVAESASVNGEDFATFSNVMFEVLYPKNWKKVKTKTGVVRFQTSSMTSDDYALFDIGTDDLSHQAHNTLEQCANDMINEFKKESTITLVKSGPTRVANHPAYQVVLFDRRNQSRTGFPLREMHIITIDEGLAYDIIFAGSPRAYGKYLPVVEKMITSFKIYPRSKMSEEFLTYANAQYRVQISYPKDWEQITQKGSVVMFKSPPVGRRSDHANFSVGVGDLSNQSKATLDQIVNQGIDQMKKAIPVTVLENKSTIIANQPARTIIYLNRMYEQQMGFPIKTMQVAAIKGNKLYILAYSVTAPSYEKYLPTIEKMLASFKIGSQ